VKVIHKVTSIRHALSAQALGVDAITVDGFECAGHPGEDDVTNLVLIPRAAEVLTVPMVASGGIANGAGLAAALALGAHGVNMGTRFIATHEAPVHENVKRQVVENSELDTVVVFRAFHNSARVARNAVSEEIVRISAQPGATFEDVAELAAGARGRQRVLSDGAMDDGMWWAGMSQGLVHEIVSAAEVVRSTVTEAEEIITGKLAGYVKD
jgi:nitronate monooxygenase